MRASEVHFFKKTKIDLDVLPIFSHFFCCHSFVAKFSYPWRQLKKMFADFHTFYMLTNWWYLLTAVALMYSKCYIVCLISGNKVEAGRKEGRKGGRRFNRHINTVSQTLIWRWTWRSRETAKKILVQIPGHANTRSDVFTREHGARRVTSNDHSRSVLQQSVKKNRSMID